jgi:hypothetical protein
MAAAADLTEKQEDRIVLNVKKEFMANLVENLTCHQCHEVPRNATVTIGVRHTI